MKTFSLVVALLLVVLFSGELGASVTAQNNQAGSITVSDPTWVHPNQVRVGYSQISLQSPYSHFGIVWRRSSNGGVTWGAWQDVNNGWNYTGNSNTSGTALLGGGIWALGDVLEFKGAGNWDQSGVFRSAAEQWIVQRPPTVLYNRGYGAQPFELNDAVVNPGDGSVQKCLVKFYWLSSSGSRLITGESIQLYGRQSYGPYEAVMTTKGDPANAAGGVEVVYTYSNSVYNGTTQMMVPTAGQDAQFTVAVTTWKWTAVQYLGQTPETWSGGVDVPVRLRNAINNVASGAAPSGGASTQIGNVDKTSTNTPTGAATQADIQDSTNAIVAALKVVDQSVKANAPVAGGSSTDTQVLAAVTANTTATNMTNSKLDTTNGSLSTISSGVSSANGKLDTLNTTATGIKTGVEGLYTKAQRDADILAGQTSANAKGASYGSELNAAKAQAQADANDAAANVENTALGQAASELAGSPMPVNNGYALTPQDRTFEGNPVLPGVWDMNPFTSTKLGTFMSNGNGAQQFTTWIRNFVEWAIVVGFLGWVWSKVYENCQALGTTQQAQLSGSTQIVLAGSVAGNSVGVIPAGTMWGLSVVVGSTLLLAAPVIIVAGFSDASGVVEAKAAAIAAKQSTSSATGWLLNILSYTYVCLPVTLVITTYINRLLVNMASVTQYIITVVAFKIIKS